MLWKSNWQVKPPEYLGIPEEKIDRKNLNAFYFASSSKYDEEVKKANKKK